MKIRADVTSRYFDNTISCTMVLPYEAALSADSDMVLDFLLAEMRRHAKTAITQLKLEQ